MIITIRTPQMQDYDRFSAIMDQVQQMHVDWRPDVYKPASPLITKELFGELLKGDSWYIAETDGIVVGVLEVFKRHVEGPAQVTRMFCSSAPWRWMRRIAGRASGTSSLIR